MQPFPSEMDTCENFAVVGGACEGMLKLRLAGTPGFGVGIRQSAERVGQLRARPDLVTLVVLKIITVVSLIQPQRFNCRFINRSRNLQAVIALEICERRPGINA